jgi:creatinine amidohydrolase
MIHELSAMTWEDVAALDRARTVAILPVGATEAHGPHLPIATDVIIAEGMARAGGGRLIARGVHALILPPLAYTPAPFAAGFAGTIGIPGSTLQQTIAGIAASLGSAGIRWLAIANAHLDPENRAALQKATETRADNAATVIFPDITQRPWGNRLTDEFRSGACHAGQYETSIVLALRPDLVRESGSALPPVMQSLSTAMREGKNTFEEAGGARAYFGNPSAATAREGMETITALASILEEAVMAVVEA